MSSAESPENPNPPKLAPAVPPKRAPQGVRWLMWGCGTLLALMLMIVATVAITIWWIQRPIKPVVLSPQEKATVDQKLRYVEAAKPPGTVPEREARNVVPSAADRSSPITVPEPDRPYVPGSKVLTLTEREINGLLNANTDLGRSVRLEFARNAINAYVAVPIPQDFPILGGKMFRARGRFDVSLGNGGAPYAILEDVTVFGLSLPKAWLGGLKGQNLLGDAMGEGKTMPTVRGIKSLRVEPGALVLEVED